MTSQPVTCCGIDFSGTPAKPLRQDEPEIYLACCVWLPDRETVENQCALWRTRFGFRADFEFHGHELRRHTAVLECIADYVLLEGSVAAVIFDKYELIAADGGKSLPLLAYASRSYLINVGAR